MKVTKIEKRVKRRKKVGQTIGKDIGEAKTVKVIPVASNVGKAKKNQIDSKVKKDLGRASADDFFCQDFDRVGSESDDGQDANGHPSMFALRLYNI